MQSNLGRSGSCYSKNTGHKIITLPQNYRVLWILAIIFFSISSYSPANLTEDKESPTIKFGITPVILDEQIQLLNDWRDYLQRQLKRPVQFIQRDSYGKITSHLLKGELDFGWICGYPFVQHQNNLNLVAVPLYNGKPLYHSYLIVPVTDRKTQGLLDMNDAVFAYSDPDSNSGYLYAQYFLKTAGKSPESFFKKSFFTWEHLNTVEAVAAGLAQGGIVDSYIWETLQKQHSSLSGRTRVAHKSKPFAFPPIVATNNVNPKLVAEMRHLLVSMAENEQGRHLLEKLNLDGFIPGEDRWYDSIRHMAETIKRETQP